MKVQIAVRGRKYTVKSDEDGVDIQRIADYVDQRMAEVSSRAVGVDEYTVAMLAALNIASDFERFRQTVDDEMASMDRELASTLVLLESVLPEDEGTMDDDPSSDDSKD